METQGQRAHFDFKEKEHFRLDIDENIVLHLKQIENSYCVLYFKHKQSDEEANVLIPSDVLIPEDVVVYDTVFSCKHRMSHPIDPRKYYFFSWSENYLVAYKSEIILSLQNPRIWEMDIRPPPSSAPIIAAKPT